MVWLPRNKKQTYGVNLRAQIYQIVTGVTSVVGVPSTHLVDFRILVISEANFQVRAFKFGTVGALNRLINISVGFWDDHKIIF